MVVRLLFRLKDSLTALDGTLVETLLMITPVMIHQTVVVLAGAATLEALH